MNRLLSIINLLSKKLNLKVFRGVLRAIQRYKPFRIFRQQASYTKIDEKNPQNICYRVLCAEEKCLCGMKFFLCVIK